MPQPLHLPPSWHRLRRPQLRQQATPRTRQCRCCRSRPRQPHQTERPALHRSPQPPTAWHHDATHVGTRPCPARRCCRGRSGGTGVRSRGLRPCTPPPECVGGWGPALNHAGQVAPQTTMTTCRQPRLHAPVPAPAAVGLVPASQRRHGCWLWWRHRRHCRCHYHHCWRTTTPPEHPETSPTAANCPCSALRREAQRCRVACRWPRRCVVAQGVA